MEDKPKDDMRVVDLFTDRIYPEVITNIYLLFYSHRQSVSVNVL